MDPKASARNIVCFVLPLPYPLLDQQNGSGCVYDLSSIRSNLCSHQPKNRPQRKSDKAVVWPSTYCCYDVGTSQHRCRCLKRSSFSATLCVEGRVGEDVKREAATKQTPVALSGGYPIRKPRVGGIYHILMWLRRTVWFSYRTNIPGGLFTQTWQRDLLRGFSLTCYLELSMYRLVGKKHERQDDELNVSAGRQICP